MRLNASSAAALAAFLPVLTQAVQFTNSAYSGVEAGQSFKLTWSGDGSDVDIILETGPSSNLRPVKSLATSVSGTSTSVQIPSDIKAGTYAFAIMQAGSTNYSPQFTLKSSSPSSDSSNSSEPASDEDTFFPTQARPVEKLVFEATTAIASASGTAKPAITTMKVSGSGGFDFAATALPASASVSASASTSTDSEEEGDESSSDEEGDSSTDDLSSNSTTTNPDLLETDTTTSNYKLPSNLTTATMSSSNLSTTTSPGKNATHPYGDFGDLFPLSATASPTTVKAKNCHYCGAVTPTASFSVLAFQPSGSGGYGGYPGGIEPFLGGAERTVVVGRGRAIWAAVVGVVVGMGFGMF